MKITRNLKPAVAGYIIDGRIGNKEVIATIVDLIARGYIDFHPKNFNWKKSKIQKLIIHNSKPNTEFEKYFLRVIFGNKEEVTISHLKEILKQRKLHHILENQIKKEGLILNIKDENVEFYLKHPNNKIKFNINNREVKTIKDWRSIKIYFILGMVIPGFFILVMLLFLVVAFIKNGGPNFEILAAIIGIFIMFILPGIYFISRPTKIVKQKIDYEGSFAKNIRSKYHELFDFLKRHPLEEGRLFNEYLSYSIAFGLDSHWQQAFSLRSDEEEFIFKDMEK